MLSRHLKVNVAGHLRVNHQYTVVNNDIHHFVLTSHITNIDLPSKNIYDQNTHDAFATSYINCCIEYLIVRSYKPFTCHDP